MVNRSLTVFSPYGDLLEEVTSVIYTRHVEEKISEAF